MSSHMSSCQEISVMKTISGGTLRNPKVTILSNKKFQIWIPHFKVSDLTGDAISWY